MSERKCFAIVPAAGVGARMGNVGNKLALRLGGVPLLVRTLTTIFKVPHITDVVVMVHAEERAQVEALCSTLQIPVQRSLAFCVGGATRQESVRRGLAYLRQHFAQRVDGALVAIHDGARCLVDVATFTKTIEQAESAGAAIAAVPVVDTIKQVDAEKVITATFDRSTLWAIQTPQVFRFTLVEEAHARAVLSKDVAIGAYDDGMLVEQIHPVKVVEGSRRNIKITYPEDLVVAEALLRE